VIHRAFQICFRIYPLSLDLRLCCLRIMTRTILGTRPAGALRPKRSIRFVTILITHKVTPVVRSLAPRRKPKSKGYILNKMDASFCQYFKSTILLLNVGLVFIFKRAIKIAIFFGKLHRSSASCRLHFVDQCG